MKSLMANCGAGETYTECAAQRNTAKLAQRVANARRKYSETVSESATREGGGVDSQRLRFGVAVRGSSCTVPARLVIRHEGNGAKRVERAAGTRLALLRKVSGR